MTAFDDVPRESTLKSEFDSKFERGAQTVDITGHIHSRPNFTYKLKILLGFFQIMVHTHTESHEHTDTRIYGYTDVRTYAYSDTHATHTYTHTYTDEPGDVDRRPVAALLRDLHLHLQHRQLRLPAVGLSNITSPIITRNYLP